MKHFVHPYNAGETYTSGSKSPQVIYRFGRVPAPVTLPEKSIRKKVLINESAGVYRRSTR
jgi:hypothetical protein